MKLEARLTEVVRYPTGTKLTGIICVHKTSQPVYDSNYWGPWLRNNGEKLQDLLGDVTLKNVVFMTHNWKGVSRADEERPKQEFSSAKQYRITRAEGAQVYHCTNTSELDLGALRLILGARPVVPKVQQEPINKGSESKQTAVTAELSKEMPELAERHNSDTKKREESMQEAVDKRVKELGRELQAEKRRAREEADGLRKRIAKMQSKESTQTEFCQELEEEKRRAQKEVDMFKKQIAEMQSKEKITQKEMERGAREEIDGLRNRIAEMQSKLEEDRHTSGKASATYLSSRHVSFHPI